MMGKQYKMIVGYIYIMKNTTLIICKLYNLCQFMGSYLDIFIYAILSLKIIRLYQSLPGAAQYMHLDRLQIKSRLQSDYKLQSEFYAINPNTAIKFFCNLMLNCNRIF